MGVATIRDQAIPIRLWEYSETSQTACLFCRENGLIRGLAKGAKREKSRFSGGMELLTRGEIVAIVRPSVELANLIEWDLQRIYPAIRASLRAHYAGLYMADLVYHGVTDHDPHLALFDALDRELDALDSPGGVTPALLRFQWTLLTETGYRPRVDEGAARSRRVVVFDPEAGGFPGDRERAASGEVWRVRPQTVGLLAALDRGESLDFGAIDGVVAERAGGLLAAYLRYLLRRELPTRALVYPDTGKGVKSAGKGD